MNGRERLGYVPALDGLRGVAIAAVVVFHAGGPSGGLYGVDIFFVLSGFLITTLLLEEWQRNGRISLRGFYMRRVRRLVPGLAAMLGVVTLGLLLVFAFGSLDAAGLRWRLLSVLTGAAYVQNVVKAFGSGQTIWPPVGHLWSLGIEEQFYIAWPLTLLWLLRRGARPRTLAIVSGLGALLVAGHRIELVLTGASGRYAAFMPTSRADPVLLGCLLGIARFYGMIRPALQRLLVLVSPFVAAGGLTLLFFANASFYPVPWLVLVELAAGATVLAVVLRPESLVGRLLSRKPIVFLGEISYSLYLWHPLCVFFFQRFGVLVAIWAALGSYKYIEAPFRRKRAASASAPRRTEGAVPTPAQRHPVGRDQDSAVGAVSA